MTAPPRKRSAEVLALVGFMGAGKSTVGRLLARRLGWAFTDTDVSIARAAGRSIGEIFRTDGETAFRRWEHDEVSAACRRRRVVIAVGGGAMAEPATRRVLLSRACVVYLEASEETLLERLRSATPRNRPLLSGERSVAELLRSRRPFYEAAHRTVVTDGLDPEETAEAIHAWWMARGGAA